MNYQEKNVVNSSFVRNDHVRISLHHHLLKSVTLDDDIIDFEGDSGLINDLYYIDVPLEHDLYVRNKSDKLLVVECTSNGIKEILI